MPGPGVHWQLAAFRGRTRFHIVKEGSWEGLGRFNRHFKYIGTGPGTQISDIDELGTVNVWWTRLNEIEYDVRSHGGDDNGAQLLRLL